MRVLLSLLFCLLLFSSSFIRAQQNTFKYQRELKGITDQWHKVILPDEIFGKVSPGLHDIRIIGITPGQDTIEAPYLIRKLTGKVTNRAISFNLINPSRNEEGYYYTFELKNDEPVNYISLDFKRQNFDWRVTVAGSHDQNEWYSIVENHRILSIKNKLTDYQFTKIVFPDSKYSYYRLLIRSKDNPGLLRANLELKEGTDPVFHDYAIRDLQIREDKKKKQTMAEITLEMPVPVSNINIAVADTIDYYRPVTIQYLADSFKTEKGWHFSYGTLMNGTLSSFEDNSFRFGDTKAKQLKVLINNYDNQPLDIENIEVKGYEYQLIARFTEPAAYYLAYGSSIAGKPNYDITRFTRKIPANVPGLETGKEQKLKQGAVQEMKPLFMNSYWLWSIMIIIILLLGWFTIGMIKKQE